MKYNQSQIFTIDTFLNTENIWEWLYINGKGEFLYNKTIDEFYKA